MKSAWFRFHRSALHSAKVQRLSPVLFRAWVNVLCATDDAGRVPSLDDLAFVLRTPKRTVEGWLTMLEGAGLLDRTPSGLVAHDWDDHQPKGDSAAERMRRYRGRTRQRLEDQGIKVLDPPNSDEQRYVTGDVTGDEKVTDRAEQNRTEQSSSSLLDAARRREPEPPKPAPVDLVCDALGIVWGSGPGHLNWPSQVGELLAMGYSLEGEILPACRDLRQRGGVGSIRAIGRYLRKVLQERAAAAKAAGVLAIEPTDERGWRSRLATFREMGVWPERWGPRIGEPGCLCPPRLATEAA